MLLRPHENSLRPGVGKIVSFSKSETSRVVRVQWYYRAEDLNDRPDHAIGEDELFETGHFDDVQLDAIAGRCRVLSYPNWLDCLVAKGNDALSSLRLKHEAAMRADREAQNEEKKQTVNGKNVKARGNARKMSNGQRNVPANKVQTIPDDRDDDVHTMFVENYQSSSILYYCRRFYDPITSKFMLSQFESDKADPFHQLEQHYDNRADDADYSATDSPPHTSDDELDDDAMFDDDFDEVKSKPTKRKRTRKHVKKRTRTHASQFALPMELGPQRLPCRDEQKEHVRSFLMDAIQVASDKSTQSSRCLYISGVPGTGKTATVREVVHDLETMRQRGELPPFKVVEVNAMSLPDPNLVYSELYTSMTGNTHISPLHAAQLLEKRFAHTAATVKKSNKRMRSGPGDMASDSCTILILDEMDVLLARKQKVLYDMLEWPTRKNARMAVIGIANTMDLPERVLPRLGSRLGVNRLSYPPYTSAQLQTILELTLDRRKVDYSPPALLLCVKKVGSVSGDVRRAMELCRRAAELLLEELAEGGNKATDKPIVKPQHMQQAIHDVAGGSRLVALAQLSLFERLVLACALDLARRQGYAEVEKTCSIAVVTDEAAKFCRSPAFKNKEDIPSIHELEEACWRLSSQRIFIIERHAVWRRSRVIVNVSSDDCMFAFRECPMVQAILTVVR